MSDNLETIQMLDEIEDKIYELGCVNGFPLEQFNKLAKARKLIIEVKNDLRSEKNDIE